MSATIDHDAALLAWLGSAERYLILEGDSAVVAPSIPDASIDAIVADPPAGIAFMGKEWDEDKGGKEHWIEWLADILREAFRVLKPGGRMVLWALPQTSHWTAEAGERAGFLLNSKTLHLFGSGFPKSTNVSKAIDSAAGAAREIVGSKVYGDGHVQNSAESIGFGGCDPAADTRPVTAPATPEARRWEGHGSALKPAAEEWLFFQRPIAPITSDQLRAVTGWDHWHSTRRLDTAKQREKAAKKYGVAIPEGGELQARNLKALHPGVPMRLELRWREAVFTEAAPASDAEGEEEAERVYSTVGEWRVLWSEEKPYKRWSTSSIAANVLAHGTGALNIDAARVGTGITRPGREGLAIGFGAQGASRVTDDTTTGRWPANLVLSHTAWEETHCPCGAVLSFVARFCPECGSAAVEHRRAGCCAVGEREAQRNVVTGERRDSFSVCAYGDGLNGNSTTGSTETVTAWECLASCPCGLSTLAPSGGAPPRCRCGRAMAWACPVARLDEQSGERPGGAPVATARQGFAGASYMGGGAGTESFDGYPDTGGASRFFNCFAPPDDAEPFFWCAKPSAAETEAGCERLPLKSAAEVTDREEGSAGSKHARAGATHGGRRNHHPTKKSIALMRHFVRLVTPPGGIVLDLFGGSGTTVCAATLEGLRGIAIEMDPEFVAIARARSAFWARLAGTKASTVTKPRPTREKADTGQGSLF